MGSLHGSCEIVELKDDKRSVQHSPKVLKLKSVVRVDDKDRKPMLKLGCSDSLEDDLNKLFAAINLKTSFEGSSPSDQLGSGPFRKNAQKQPLRTDSPRSLGIGVSEPVSLKQALRGLCISQASEMAAMKRLAKSPGPGYSGVLDGGRINGVHKPFGSQTNESGLSLEKGKEDIVEISLVSEERAANHQGKIAQRIQVPKIKVSSKSTASSPRATSSRTTTRIRTLTTISKESVPLSVSNGGQSSKAKVIDNEKIRSPRSPACSSKSNSSSKPGKSVSGSPKLSKKALGSKPVQRDGLESVPSSSRLSKSGEVTKSTRSPRNLGKPVVVNKNIVNKITKEDPIPTSSTCNVSNEVDSGSKPREGLVCQRCQCTLQNESVESKQSNSVSNCSSADIDSVVMKPGEGKKGFSSNSCSSIQAVGAKPHKNGRPNENGEFSQSSKSSLGEYSTSTSISEESILSRPSCGNRPHMSKNARWKAIRRARLKYRVLGLEQFNLLKKLGCGDIGTVYLAELIDSNCLFAIKVMDNEYLERRKKMPRAQAEREILRILDHPFLPTLYAHFTSDNLSCLVMEYCPGGDLHVLRQRQPGRNFPEQAARFYAAEVLLALEYLHMLGVVYRDLKPENILVREDGHIMLTDFDLSLRCSVSPTLLKSSSSLEPTNMVTRHCRGSSCIDPSCIEPSCQVPCFSPRFLPAAARERKLKADLAAHIRSLPQLVAEPTSARSNSFVGTHEYLAPEIIKGEGHGSAVDWWTFGIFLYELLYGRTPFKGPGNEETLANVVMQSLKFPDSPLVSFKARDLIKGLLVKDPDNRIGSERGAAEIKQHPFFEGLNWALIRCTIPPEVPEYCDFGAQFVDSQNKESKFLEYRATGEHLEFELF